MVIDFDNITILVSLIVALISLLISVVALKISKRTFLYSTKDYIPDLTYTIDENDSVTIRNQSRKIFKIDYINFLKIRIIGFEDYVEQATVEIPIIEESLTFRWLKKDGRDKKIEFDKNASGPCAYGLCSYDRELVVGLNNKIEKDYSPNSKKGYRTPGLQGLKYILEIVYTDPFKERKSLIFQKNHLHGYGFDDSRISDKELEETLEYIKIPKFDSLKKLWKYSKEKYSRHYS